MRIRSGVAAETAGSYAPTHGQHPLTAALAEATTALSTAATLTLDDVDPAQLTGALDTVARLSRTLAAVQARVVRAVDRAQLARDQGATDTTALLKDRLKLSGRDAKRAVELGRGLESLPQTTDALAAGELGIEQAEQLTRAAKRGVLGAPKLTEAQLLDTAKTTTPESFRDEVTRREHAADGDRLLRDERRAHARRSLRTWRTPDGLGAGTWTADPTNHDAIVAFIQANTAPDPADTPDELRRSPDQTRFDGLMAGIHAALDAGHAPQTGGERPHISVIVDYDTYLAAIADGDHTPDGDGRRTPDTPAGPPAETGWAGPISTTALQRLCCDAQIVRIIASGTSQVIDVGRATREWNGSQRRAIVALDGGCRFPGCDRPPAWTNIHHVRWWGRDRGPTDIANGALLCIHHHHLVHEGGWTMTMHPTTREVTVASPDRLTRLTSHPPGAIPRHATQRRRPTP